MKLLSAISVLILAVSGRSYNNPIVQSYAHSAEASQSGLEQQQDGLYSPAGISNPFNNKGGFEAATSAKDDEKKIKIVGLNVELNGHQYRYAYETENGIKAQEEGTVDKGTSAHGAFSYTGDDGHVYTLSYIADEHGFRPVGDHLPTPPPIPEGILKGIEQNAKEEAAGIFDDGKYNHEDRGHQDHGLQEHGHQEHQQIGGGHQSTQFRSSAQSGASLAHYAQAVAQDSSSSHHKPSGHSSGSSSYYTPSSYHVTSSDQHSPSSQGSKSGYSSPPSKLSHEGYKTSSGQQSSLGHHLSIGHGAHKPNSGLQSPSSSVSNLGYEIASGGESSLGYQLSSGGESNLGYQLSSGSGANLGYQLSSGSGSNVGYHLSSGNEASLGQTYPINHGSTAHQLMSLDTESGLAGLNYKYKMPSSFTASPSYSGNSGHFSGMTYLPPLNHLGYEMRYYGK